MEVQLCRPDDARLASRWGEQGGFEQYDDDPVLLVIGSRTSDEKLERLAARFGVPLQRLRSFRDGDLPMFRQ